MRSKLRRSLSIATVLGLVVGSVALAAPAQADPATSVTITQPTTGDHFSVAKGDEFTFDATINAPVGLKNWVAAAYKVPTGEQTIIDSDWEGDELPSPVVFDTDYWDAGYYHVVISARDADINDVSDDFYLSIVDGSGAVLTVAKPTGTLFSGDIPVEFSAVDPAGTDFPFAVLYDEGCGESAGTVSLTESGNVYDRTWTGTIDSTGLADGDYCLQLGAASISGTSTAQQKTFTVDNNAPAVPTIETQYTFSPGKLVLGEVDDVSGVTYRYQLDDSGDYHFFDPIVVTSTSNVLDVPAGLDDGGYYLQAAATDGAGHDSGWTPGLPTVYVLTAPKIVAPAADADIDDELTLTWEANWRYREYLDEFEVRFRYEGDPADDADDEEFTRSVTAPTLESTLYGTETLSAVLDFDTTHPDGPWAVDIRGILDHAGAPYPEGPWSTPVTIDRHGFVPSSPTGLAPSGEVWSVDTLSWDADPVADHYEYRYASSLVGLDSATVHQTDDTSVAVSGLTKGNWMFQVRSVDADGDVGGWAIATVQVVGSPGFDFAFCPFAPLPLCNFFGTYLQFDIDGVNSEDVDHYEVEYTELLDVTTGADDVVRTEDSFGTEADIELPEEAGDGLYSVRVRAVLEDELEPTDSATSAWSDPAIFIRDATRAAAPDLVAPATVGPFQHKVTLDWTDLNEALLWEVRVAKGPEVVDDELVDYDTYLVFDPKVLPWLELLFAGELGGVPEDFSCEDLLEGFPSDDDLTLVPKCGSSLELKNLKSGHYGWQTRGIEFIGMFGFLLGGDLGCGCTDGEWSDVGLFTIDNPKPPKGDAKPETSAGSSDGETSDDPDSAEETEEPVVDEPAEEEPDAEEPQQPVDQPGDPEDPEAAPAGDGDGLPAPALIAIIAALVLILGGGGFFFVRFLFLRRA